MSCPTNSDPQHTTLNQNADAMSRLNATITHKSSEYGSLDKAEADAYLHGAFVTFLPPKFRTWLRQAMMPPPSGNFLTPSPRSGHVISGQQNKDNSRVHRSEERRVGKECPV